MRGQHFKYLPYVLTDIDYPIYLYNSQKGMIKKAELSLEIEEQITNSLVTTQIFYWPDDYLEPVLENKTNINSQIR